MKPPPFQYHRADSIEEAVALLAEYADEAKVLAGGQSLLPLLSLRFARPAHLIDVNPVAELGEVMVNGELHLGATVRHRRIERTGDIVKANPLLAEAASLIGHVAIRNRGTVGGSVAHADPAAELPTVLSALGGSVGVTSARGTRQIRATGFFSGFLTTSLAPDELVTRVIIPVLPGHTGWSFTEFTQRSGDFALVGVAATVSLDDDGLVADARLAFCGVGSTPHNATGQLGVLGERPSSDLWIEAGRRAAQAVDPSSDLHGSAQYRKHLAGVLAGRALARAATRAIGSRTAVR